MLVVRKGLTINTRRTYTGENVKVPTCVGHVLLKENAAFNRLHWDFHENILEACARWVVVHVDI